ncbi:hypothetical protein NMY22_g4835 [Coprinellus aureogranulatus]|nr:hypothetical protein NMY22_g4835 [Coprinellus aureogranulatus]
MGSRAVSSKAVENSHNKAGRPSQPNGKACLPVSFPSKADSILPPIAIPFPSSPAVKRTIQPPTSPQCIGLRKLLESTFGGDEAYERSPVLTECGVRFGYRRNQRPMRATYKDASWRFGTAKSHFTPELALPLRPSCDCPPPQLYSLRSRTGLQPSVPMQEYDDAHASREFDGDYYVKARDYSDIDLEARYFGIAPGADEDLVERDFIDEDEIIEARELLDEFLDVEARAIEADEELEVRLFDELSALYGREGKGKTQACAIRLYPAERSPVKPRGGRFLVTAGVDSQKSEGTACIWDLGYNLNSPVKPFPIASTPTYGRAILSISAFPSSNGRLLRIAVLGIPLNLNEMKLAVYTIDPTCRTPQFNLEREQRMGSVLCPYMHYTEPIVVLKSGSIIYAWNWAEGKGCRWRCGGLLNPEANISLYGRTIVAMDTNQDFVIWDIPETLPTADSTQELEMLDYSPKRVCRRRAAGEELPCMYIASTPSWQQHGPPHLCLTLDEDEVVRDGLRVFLFSLRKMGEQDKAFLPAYLPVAGGTSTTLAEDYGEPINGPVSPLFLCDGRLVLCSRTSGNELVASILPVPAGVYEGPFEPCWASLVQGMDVDDVYLDPSNVGFCPMSGRVVHPISYTSFEISDFLLPLEESGLVTSRGRAMELNFDFKLSSDLVVQVLRFLDPVDILAMRATCKMFRRVSASRTVWIAALERVCEQHGIFKPTYPLDKMTCAELESAASGPHRFTQFISDSFQKTHPKRAPSLTRQFPCWKVGTGSGFPERLHDVERLFIVPGGRFLLTAGDSLCLWDLGYSIATPMKPFPVASLPILLEPLFLTASPSVNGQELTIALVCRSYLEFQTVSHSIASVHLLGDTAVIKSGHGIHVWNWVENTGCQWENSDADFYSQAVVVDQTVIAIDDFQNFLIWDIPPLIPLLNIEGQLAKVQNPEKRILQGTPQTEALGNDTVTISSGSVWQRHTQPHLCFTADELFRDWTGPKFLLHSLQMADSVGGIAFVPLRWPFGHVLSLLRA